MQIFSKIFGRNSNIRRTAIQNGLFAVTRATYRSGIKPVKLAFKVYESSATDPNRPPLVIMHGLFGSKENWNAISKALEIRTKRKIYNVDDRNHGDSPHDDAHSSRHTSTDIAFLMEQENLQRISVMGHSLGGRSLAFFALKYPELVEKGILVDISPISLPKFVKDVKGVLFAMKNVKVSPELTLEKGRVIAENQLREIGIDKVTLKFAMPNLRKLKTGEFGWRLNVAAVHANFQDYFDNQQFFEMTPHTGPMLFIAGQNSKFMSPSDWPSIKEIFPNAELKWLDAGHLVHIEQQEKFMNIVTEFLK